MFPSTNCDNPFDSSYKSSSYFPYDQNPSSKQDDPPFLFNNFPSPFFDENELPLNQMLLQINHPMARNNQCNIADQTGHFNTDPIKIKDDASKRNIIGTSSKLDEKEADPPIPSAIISPLRRRNVGAIPRRRTGKKDRHSKICTAQGIRDRRMRLSLQVARKFFDLQDILGYDKASKTIDWLFKQSKKAIKELSKDHPEAIYNISSTNDAKSESDCEVVSEIEENSKNDVKQSVVQSEFRFDPRENDEGNSRKATPCKQSREKARAKARCRTREKMMVKCLDYSVQKWPKSNPAEDYNLDQKLGFSSNSPFEVVDQQSNSINQERVSPYGAVCSSSLLEQQLADDVGTIEKLLGNSISSSSSTILSSCPNISDYYQYPSFMGFHGNWDLLSNIGKTNSIHHGVTDQVISLAAGNPNTINYVATPNYP